MTDEDVRALLRQLRDEPVPADSLARVRLAVDERRAAVGVRHFGLAWKFAGALAAMAVVVFVAVLVRPSQPSASLTVKVRESVAASPVPPPAIVKSERRRKVQNRRNTAAKDEGVVVRIETTDPDVVILLIGD